MPTLTLEGLTKTFPAGGFAAGAGAVRALDGVGLTVAAGEWLTVVGPSGGGKSTMLRIVAGLERPDAGTVSLDGRRIDALPPRDRDVAMVFQGDALYPHLTAADNIAFGLRMRGTPAAEVSARVAEAAAAMGITDALGRRPSQLSGGQRRRVALARAVVRRPAVFLLDEPLTGLDAGLRAEMIALLRRIRASQTAATIHVTHDQAEATALADRIAVLDGGRLRQVAAPDDILDRPADAFVAGFFGTPPMNLIDGEIAADPDTGRPVFRGGGLTLPLPTTLGVAADAPSGPSPRRRVRLGVRPERIAPAATAGASQMATVTARVEAAERVGEGRLLRCVTIPADGRPAASFAVRLGPATGGAAPTVATAAVDAAMTFVFDLSSAQLFDAGSGANLTHPR
jgi:multiple sugar transport system ATP-binding protein